EVDYGGVIDDLPDACAVGFDGEGFGLDQNLLADSAHFESGVNGGIGVDVEDDAGLDVVGEAFLGNFQAVGSDDEAGKEIGSVSSADGGAKGPGVGLDHADLGAGDGGAGGVLDGSGDLGRGDRLRPDSQRNPQKAEQKSNRS